MEKKFKPGDSVIHLEALNWGVGTIIEADDYVGNRVAVNFQKVGVKRLDLNYAKLAPAGLAPVKLATGFGPYIPLCPSLNAEGQELVQNQRGERTLMTMTQEEKDICSRLGISEEDYQVEKNREEAHANAMKALNHDEQKMCKALGVTPVELLNLKEGKNA